MSRPWRLVVFAAVLVVLAAIVLPLGYGVRFLAKGHQVRDEIARIRAAGEPVSAADLRSKPIPDGQNAAVIYEKAFKLLPPTTPSNLQRFCDPDERARDPRLWGQAQDIVRQYTPALELAQKAAAKPKCRFDIQWDRGFETDMPQYGALRRLATLSCARAILEAKAGHASAAVGSVDLAVRLSNALGQEPGLMAVLVRFGVIGNATSAIRSTCQVCAVDEAQARRLADSLEAIDLRDSMARALQGERVLGVTMYEQFCRGELGGSARDKSADDSLRRLGRNPIARLAVRNDEAGYLREIRAYINASHLPYRKLDRALREGESKSPRYSFMAAMLLPVYGRAAGARDRAIANLAGNRIYLGLVAYRGRFGDYPATLDELKKLDWLLPEDPFSGKPFVYRREGRGFVLYSIGDDLKDDGGVEPMPIRGRKHSTSRATGDMVWKLDK